MRHSVQREETKTVIQSTWGHWNTLKAGESYPGNESDLETRCIGICLRRGHSNGIIAPKAQIVTVAMMT